MMNQLISALLDELDGKRKHMERIKEVRIEVGELTFLGEDQLQFAFKTLSKDTIVEDAELDVIKISSEVKCENCGYEGGINYSDNPNYHYNIPVISCPECDSKPKIIEGKETRIVGVTAVEKEGKCED